VHTGTRNSNYDYYIYNNLNTLIAVENLRTVNKTRWHSGVHVSHDGQSTTSGQR